MLPFQFRRDTALAWTASNRVLAEGELGLEKDTGLYKFGNGIDGWNSRPYATGNNGEVQSLLMPSMVEDPAPSPAGSLRMYAKPIAGRLFPKFVGPSGLSTSLQPLLARNKVGYWCPPGNAVTQPGVFGYTPLTTTGITVALRTVAVTNIFTRMRRLGFVSAATASAAISPRVAIGQVTLSDGAGEGGFFKIIRWGISDVTVPPAARTFVGVSSSTGATAGTVEPSTFLYCVGMGADSTDTNFKIMYGGSVAQPPIDLGPNFPSNTSNIDVYELALFAPPNDAGMYWEVTRLNTGHVATGYIAPSSLTVTLPNQNNLLSYQYMYRSNGGALLAVGLDIMSDYIETDL